MNENQLLWNILQQVKRVFGPSSTPAPVGASNINILLTGIRDRFKVLAA